MSKYTFLLEYYKKEAPCNVYQTLWSDDEDLDDSFLLTEQDTHNIILNSKSRLGGYLTTFPNREQSMKDLWRREDSWKIEIRVRNRYKNRFSRKECVGVSESFNDYLTCLSKGLYLLDFPSLTDEDVADFKKALSQYDVPAITNYLYVKSLSPFVFKINKVKTLNEILTIARDIEHILGKYILNYDHSEDLVIEKGAYSDLRFAILSEIDKISGFLATMTEPLGFQYRYTPYISFAQFFRRLKRLIEMEIDYRAATTEDKEEAAEKRVPKEKTEGQILEELVPYGRRMQFNLFLDGIRRKYIIDDLSKLDFACLLLLIRDLCPLLDQNRVKTFKKFMTYMCLLLNKPTVSYKENDCIERKRALYKEEKIFWDGIQKKYRNG